MQKEKLNYYYSNQKRLYYPLIINYGRHYINQNQTKHTILKLKDIEWDLKRFKTINETKKEIK